jgi:hypothetical protein
MLVAGAVVWSFPGFIDLLTNPFNQFDPSLGTLNSITATIGGNVVFTSRANPATLFVNLPSVIEEQANL